MARRRILLGLRPASVANILRSLGQTDASQAKVRVVRDITIASYASTCVARTIRRADSIDSSSGKKRGLLVFE